MSTSFIDSVTLPGLISLADVVARATALLALVWAIVSASPRSSAASRHRLWSLALGGILVLPALTWCLPGWRLPILPAAAGNAASVGTVEGGTADPDGQQPSGPTRAGLASRATHTAAPPSPVRSRWDFMIVSTLWGLGFLTVLLPALVGFATNARRRGASRRVVDLAWLELLDGLSRRLRFGRPVELRVGPDESIPITWGVVRPVILLPESSRDWPQSTRRRVLLHELAHVGRCDVLFQLIGRLAAAVYWFHPLAWFALHRLRVECESACDDCVVEAGERRTDYAQELVAMARTLVSARLAAAVPICREQTLEGRLRTLFDDRRSHRPPGLATTLGLLAGGLAVVTGLAIARPSAPAAGPSRPAAAVAARPGEGTGGNMPEIDTHPITVTGRAVDRSGRPIPGAQIYLASGWPETRRLAETTANDDGRYEFRDVPLPLHRAETVNGEYEGTFEVFGQAVGFGFAWRQYQRVSPQRGPANREAGNHFNLDLRFSPATHLSGIIVDDQGKPIPGVRLEIRGCESLVPVNNVIGLNFNTLNQRDTVPPAIKVRTTDANGKFFFTGLPTDCRFDIDVRAKGFPDRWLLAATTDEPQPDHDGNPVHATGMTVTLATAFDVPVRLVLADTGQPAAKAFVQAGGERVNHAKTTDAEGRVTLRLPPGKYRMQNWPAFGTPYVVTEGELVVGAKPPEAPTIASLRPASVLEVLVIDAETGEGVPGIDLWHQALPDGDREPLVVRSWEVETRIARRDRPRTDPRGRVRVLIEPGKHRIGVGGKIGPPVIEVLEPGGKPVDCRAGETTSLRFVVRTIRGGERMTPKTSARSDRPRT